MLEIRNKHTADVFRYFRNEAGELCFVLMREPTLICRSRMENFAEVKSNLLKSEEITHDDGDL